MKEGLERFFDIVGKILASILIITWIVFVTNCTWHYLDGIPVLLKIVLGIKEYGSLLLMGIVGAEAAAKRNIVWKIVFIVLVAIIVIFQFFPGTYEYLLGLIR